MSWRRVKVLIEALPADAAMFRSVEGMGGWTLEHHMLASIIDSLGAVAHNALLGPHVDPRALRRVKPPQPVERPTTRRHRRKRRRATSEDLKRMFGGGAAYRPKEVSS